MDEQATSHNTDLMEETNPKHRPNIKLGNYADCDYHDVEKSGGKQNSNMWNRKNT